MLRGSWSQAFRAPNLITVNESLVVRNNTRTDWTCTYAADFGGDPDQDTLDCRNTIQRRATGSKELKAEKSDMIIEAMDAMLVATGADIARITEAKEVLDESGAVSLQAELDKSSEKVDALVEENIALEKRGAELLKMGVIAELKEGMSTLEAEKFGKLANLVEFEDSSVYLEKLETIKESIGTKKPEEKIEEKFEKIEEKKEEKTSLSTSFSHLI